ncbi:MAG: SIMPL domain-containing protein [Burkholderiales bacterium]|nr:SIMPL domain-containing protein [Burkholderiales bacterium]
MKFVFGLLIATTLGNSAFAQQITAGTVVTVSGQASIKVDNDQAVATFFVEEQDKDKSLAASRVNQKMKIGTEIIKKDDPQAQLATKGYYTYPVYSEEVASGSATPRKRQVIAWRVGQYLELKTQNLKQLPFTAAAAQKSLALSGISFGLSEIAQKNLDAKKIEAGYQDFANKVKVITKTMGHKDNDVTIESVDFDGGNDGVGRAFAAEPMMLKSAMRSDSTVVEPSFEPGVTTIYTVVKGKVRIR